MYAYGVLFAGLTAYFISVILLTGHIKQQNQVRSLLRLIDKNQDGLLTTKELDKFPYETIKNGKLKKELKRLGNKADLYQLSELVPIRVLHTQFKKQLAPKNPFLKDDTIRKISPNQIGQQFLDTYDVNQDGQVVIAQYNLINDILKCSNSKIGQIFRLFDKNVDWKVTNKEATKIKGKKFMTTLKMKK